MKLKTTIGIYKMLHREEEEERRGGKKSVIKLCHSYQQLQKNYKSVIRKRYSSLYT